MPKEPPKAPERAPFFLPTSSTGAIDNANAQLSGDPTPAELSRIGRVQLLKGTTQSSRLASVLQAGYLSGNFDSFFSELKSLTPAKLEVEIRSLNPQVEGDQSELSAFILALSDHLASKRDFELVNAWMAVFLRIHSDAIAACSESSEGTENTLRSALSVWSRVQRTEIQRLAGLVSYCRGVVGFLRSAR